MPRGGKSYLLIQQTIEAPDIHVVRNEMPTLTCVHCNCIVVLNPMRSRPRSWCMRCDAYVCDKRYCITECNPFTESLELSVNNDGDDAYLLRGNEGEILFDPRKRDDKKVH